jgi:hypothetical protein
MAAAGLGHRSIPAVCPTGQVGGGSGTSLIALQGSQKRPNRRLRSGSNLGSAVASVALIYWFLPRARSRSRHRDNESPRKSQGVNVRATKLAFT